MRLYEKCILISLVFINLLVWTSYWLEVHNHSTKQLEPQIESSTLVETIDQESLIIPQTLQTPGTFVPILMYHYIRDYSNSDDQLGVQLSVSPQTFQKQMQTLRENGYQTISLTEYASGSFSVKKPIILTFDDGYLDQYDNAFPILNSFGFTATFFIVRDFIGRQGYMTLGQIQNLKTKGMEVGGHSTSHKNLATMEYEKLVLEVRESLKGYDQVFSYPAGKYSPVTLDVVSGLNLKAAVTTKTGIATEYTSRYELPRIRVKEKTDIIKRINEEILIAKKDPTVGSGSRD